MSKTTGLVAQLDRVPDYGSGGCGFDSRLVHTKGSAKRTFFWPIRLEARSSDSHSGNSGSIPLWATDFPHITQLKINQLGFFLPPKIPRRVNHVSTDFRNFIYLLTRHRKIFIKHRSFFPSVDTPNPPFEPFQLISCKFIFLSYYCG